MVWRRGVRGSSPGRTAPGPRADWWCIPGWPSAQGDLSPCSSAPAWPPENPGSTQDQPSAARTQELASWANQFLAKVRTTPAFPGGHTGLTPREQSLSPLEGEALRQAGLSLPCWGDLGHLETVRLSPGLEPPPCHSALGLTPFFGPVSHPTPSSCA